MTGDLVRASVLALVAAVTSDSDATAGSVFEGTWSVTAVTQQGGCDPTYNFSVHIAAGIITLPGFAGFSGHVTDGGAVQASVSTSGTQVIAFGNLVRSAPAMDSGTAAPRTARAPDIGPRALSNDKPPSLSMTRADLHNGADTFV